MIDPAPPLLPETHVEARQNLWQSTNVAFQRGELELAAAWAQATGIMSIVTVLERIEDTLDRIDETLAEAFPKRDP